MTSIRRTLSPIPGAEGLMTGEAVNVSSPLSRTSLSSPHHVFPMNGFLDTHALVYRVQGFFIGLFSKRSGRPLERSKHKGNIWRRYLRHFLVCFMLGVFIGITSFAFTRCSINTMSKYQGSDEMAYTGVDSHLHRNEKENIMSSEENFNSIDNATEVGENVKRLEQAVEVPNGTDSDIQSPADNSTLELNKLLIIVTPTYARPLQAYYLTRLVHTLKLVPPPLLWIVVELTAQSAETADLLRKTGLMYRHLVSDDNNLTTANAKVIDQRNVALSHIEKHRLDGIIYFADDDNIYSSNLFDQVRRIRRFGTWMVAKLMEIAKKPVHVIEGPVCNGSEVIGWKTEKFPERTRRFHADIAGIAFNSTILWDPKRWHRHTQDTIRQRDSVEQELQASAFIEQIVEDESQMECISTTMVWHIQFCLVYSKYPRQWLMETNLDVVVPLLTYQLFKTQK